MLARIVAFPRTARISVSTFFFVAGICFASWASRIPDIQHHLKLDDAELGSVLFAMPIGSMLCLPLAGVLVTKFGSRIVMLCGSFLYALVLCLLGASNTTWELVLALFLFGISGNLMNISVNTQGVAVEALYKRSIMASFHGLWSFAGFAGAAIGTFMIAQKFPPVVHFVIIALLVVLLVVFMYRHSLNERERVSKKTKVFALPDKSLMNLGNIAFCCMACEGCMFDWSGIYFRDIVHTPQHLVTLGYTAFMATMAMGRFTGDWLVTKLGVKRVLEMSGCCIASGLMISILFPDLFAATAGFLLTGFGVSSVVPLAYGLAGKSRTMHPGMAIAAVSTIGYLGFLLGPPVIGYIAKASNLRWSFALIAVLGSCTAVLASKIKTEQ